MITGSTWKAKTLPSSGRTGPNRKPIPSPEVSMTDWKPSESEPSARRPGGQSRVARPPVGPDSHQGEGS
ncbi:hypothetical protein GCM10009821_29210 [Aeromicrobium halocynthiae]|uniref:Uncharacterized protein n=1 Tax=Aeromicrobium halocynthiae TaxID=560557 RepID=A0ABN2W8L3_9ACTN